MAANSSQKDIFKRNYRRDKLDQDKLVPEPSKDIFIHVNCPRINPEKKKPQMYTQK